MFFSVINLLTLIGVLVFFAWCSFLLGVVVTFAVLSIKHNLRIVGHFFYKNTFILQI